MIEAENGHLYTGITNHLLKRWRAHCSGQGAKFFRRSQPKQLVWWQFADDRSAASKIEYHIKQLSVAKKRHLVESCDDIVYPLVDETS